MKQTLLPLGFVLLITSCVYGPSTEKKHPLNYLNGENYDASQNGSPDVYIVPVIKTNQRLTHIAGDLRPDSSIPQVTVIPNLELGLFDKKNHVIDKTRADPTGHFVFNGVIANGEYTVRPLSKMYRASQTFVVSDYNVNGIIVFVMPTEP